MIKWILAAALAVLPAGISSNPVEPPADCCSSVETLAARGCQGGTCYVCTNCRSCKWCKGGGSCSVCSSSSTSPPVTPTPSPIFPPTAVTPTPTPRPPPPKPPTPIARPPVAQPTDATPDDANEDAAEKWHLRSRHFIYGMPVPTDDRFRYKLPSGRSVCGLSVIVKEGFVVGHNDREKSPAWVSMRWTEDDFRRSESEPANDRDFKDDDELPNYAKGGTNLDNATSGLQRGHMARQQDNKAWGPDNVAEGCEMSNIAPQLGAMNAGIWNELEDAHRKVVANPATGIKCVWVITGTIFDRDKPLKYVGNKRAVPDAFYKVIGWFDRQGRFQARAFIVSQDDKRTRPEQCLVTVDEVERRTGLDFFSELPDATEDLVEADNRTAIWN